MDIDPVIVNGRCAVAVQGTGADASIIETCEVGGNAIAGDLVDQGLRLTLTAGQRHGIIKAQYMIVDLDFERIIDM